jgi:hypothetical protein
MQEWWVPLGSLAFAVLTGAVLLQPRLVGWFRAPSLTIEELRAFRLLDDPTGPVRTYFEWREAQWSQLAKGLAAAGVTLLIALVGATLDSAKTVTERTQGGSAAAKVTTTEIPAEDAASSAVAIGVLWIAAAAAWSETQNVQRGYVADVARLAATKAPSAP